MHKTSRLSIISVLLFVTALWVPSFQMWSHLFTERKNCELRVLAERPDAAILLTGDLRKFLSHYEKYFNDNFGFRNNLVFLNNLVRTRYLKVLRPIPNVFFGQDGWMFYEYNNALADYCGVALFTPAQLQKVKNEYERIYNRLHEKNIYFLLVIAPDKHSIYPEYLPKHFRRLRNQTRLDQVVSLLKNDSPVPIVDLRPPLIEAKKDFPVYFKTDTHWNAYGAYVAYREIMKALSKRFPALRPESISDFNITTVKNEGEGDLARMLSMVGSLSDTSITLKNRVPARARNDGPCRHFRPVPGQLFSRLQSCRKEVPGANLPRLVMFHDSFGSEFLNDYLAEDFSKSTFMWDYNIDLDEITEKEKPNVVIIEVVERMLSALFK